MAVSGMGRLFRRLNLLPRQLTEGRNEALREWATDLEKTAKELAPVRTGRLRNSIKSEINYGTGKAFIHVTGGAREYAYYVEKGTSKMADQPYLGPAAQIHRRTGERALRRIIPRRLRG